ncbi:hypothetical protein BZA05DRAFT_380871 [Tricharina praecox]|uniref:uncharacterized protein n=1 Tax=Tricharina praecox TaxID=43433 RepID=UPI002221011B|nr:uncharacterized protein BZA05DRAFT_380871 [Tricharina praecox]KAI5858331.1 hypothetical protein BZA05DRAFT_380871 [Tricharina praecox]
MCPLSGSSVRAPPSFGFPHVPTVLTADTWSTAHLDRLQPKLSLFVFLLVLTRPLSNIHTARPFPTKLCLFLCLVWNIPRVGLELFIISQLVGEHHLAPQISPDMFLLAARYVDHRLDVAISRIWTWVYKGLWNPTASTILPTDIHFFLEIFFHYVFFHVVGPLTVRLLAVYAIYRAVRACLNEHETEGWARQTIKYTNAIVRYLVTAMFTLLLVCSGIDGWRTAIPLAEELARTGVASIFRHPVDAVWAVVSWLEIMSRTPIGYVCNSNRYMEVICVLAPRWLRPLRTLQFYRWFIKAFWKDLKHLIGGVGPYSGGFFRMMRFWSRFHGERWFLNLRKEYVTWEWISQSLYPDIPQSIKYAAGMKGWSPAIRSYTELHRHAPKRSVEESLAHTERYPMIVISKILCCWLLTAGIHRFILRRFMLRRFMLRGRSRRFLRREKRWLFFTVYLFTFIVFFPWEMALCFTFVWDRFLRLTRLRFELQYA